ncbi:MAG: VanZ family protein [Saccharofermentanales bacterium]
MIFYNSAQNGESSGNASNNLTHYILNALTQAGIISACNYTPVEIARVEGIIRSVAHFIEFFILGIFAYKLVFYTLAKKSFKRILYPFVFCGLYALTDEIHQYFVPGRAMQLSDWLTDAAGITVAIVIIYFCDTRRRFSRGR